MTRNMTQPSEIHTAVKDRYGKIAATLEMADEAACCAADTLYDVALLENLPTSVTDLSLGCGDPVTLASLEPGQTVLDLGSGAGIDVFIAARQVGPSGHVIGIDMTDEMLAKAQANKASLGEAAQHVDFRKGYIESLPLEDSSVDVILSNCVINLSPDKPQVFREAFRVLKPGGKLAVSDIVIEGQFSPESRANMDEWAACVSGAVDAQDYLAAIRAAGFADIEMADKNLAGENIISLPVESRNGPRIYSARVTAVKPEQATRV